MNSVIKIDSNQGTFDLTSAKSNVDIDIPANIGNVDLSQSYVSINTRTVAQVTNQKAAGGGVNNPYIKYNLDSQNDLHISDTAALVSNANFSSRKGRLEDIRRVSLLRNTLSCYKRDLAEVQSGSNKLSTFEFSKKNNAHQLTEISKIDDIKSREIAHEIHIPLKDIFNVCKSDGFDTSAGAHGHSRIHLEMKFKDLAVAVNNTIDNSTIEGTANEWGNFNSIAASADAAGQTRDFLTSSHTYQNDANAPWFVGQYVRIAGNKTVVNAAAAVFDVVITKVERNSGRAVTLYFANDPIVLAQNQGFDAVTIVDNATIVPAGTSLSITGVQLVASISPESAPKQLNYTTFDSEEDSYPATTSANRQYQVPPAVKNVYVMFFESADDTQQRSFNQRLDTYRITLDNKEVTTRPVQIGGKVHLDLIQQVFVNNGEQLKNIRETQMVNKAADDAANLDNIKNRMIAIPIPFKATPTQLQLELNAVGGNLTGHHILYYEKVVQN